MSSSEICQVIKQQVFGELVFAIVGKRRVKRPAASVPRTKLELTASRAAPRRRDPSRGQPQRPTGTLPRPTNPARERCQAQPTEGLAESLIQAAGRQERHVLQQRTG